MTVRKKLETGEKGRAAKQGVLPHWVKGSGELTQLLYMAAYDEYQYIKERILNGSPNNAKQRKIVHANVAKRAEKHRSALTPGRQKKLCEWICEKNEELEQLAISLKKAKKKNKPTRRELEKEIASLKKGYQKNTEAELRTFVENVFSSNVLDERDKLARENLRIKDKNLAIEKKLEKLEVENNRLNEKISNLYKVLTDKQKAKLAGLHSLDYLE